jgi:polysaccharide pyruvyl transferase WcaK-like protein
MRDNGFETVFVATDARDHWFSPLSREVGCTFVPSRVPLSAGVRVLSGARAMVSGRYHPSVLASNLGVPIVCMQSNSHKTRSLQLVMGKSNPTEHEFFEPAGLDALLADSLAAAQTEPEGRRRIVTRSEELRSQVAELIAGL